MTDSYLLLTPLLVLGVLALVRFVGCNPIFGLGETILGVPGPVVQAEPGDRHVVLRWNFTDGDVQNFIVKYGTNPGALSNSSGPIDPDSSGQHQFDVGSLDNGTTYFFVVATKSNNTDKGFYDSDPVSATPGVTPFVMSQTFGPPRNNFSGWVGMAITVGGADVIVTQLGRIVGPANVQSHVVKIVDAGPGNADLASVTVNMPAGPPGEYAYVSLATPFTLEKFRQYFIVSHETAGGDQFFDLPTVVVTNPIANVTSGVFNDDAAPVYAFQGSAGQTYVPVNFRF